KTHKSGIMALMAAGSLAFASCSGSSTDETTTTDSINSSMDNGFNMSSDKMRDTIAMATPAVTDSNKVNQDFITYAVPKNAAEIDWMMAAKTTGTSKELKSHAEMMLRDHKKLEATVKGYLGKHTNIAVPAVDTTGTVNLTETKGDAWDKAFVAKMVSEHEDLISHLNDAENSVTDADLKKIVTSTKPVVQSHLDMVKGMQSKMK
ncbi:MAG: DUF4142 domain-containing protein, partial [Ginsengibacter sp.]